MKNNRTSNENKTQTGLIPVPNALKTMHDFAKEKIPKVEEQFAESKDPNEEIESWLLESEDGNHQLDFSEKIPLSLLLEKVYVLGGTEGYMTFISLYEYVYRIGKLGKKIDLRPQDVMNTISDKPYNMSAKNKHRFVENIMKLANISFLVQDKESTKRKEKQGKNDAIIWKKFRILDYEKLEQSKTNGLFREIINLNVLGDVFTNLTKEEYKRISKVFVPSSSIFRIPNDRNKNKSQAFIFAVTFRLSQLAQQKDFLVWDLEKCLRAGQWTVAPHRKKEAWTTIIKALDEGAKQSIISYELIHRPNKPEEHKHIQKVKVTRLYSVDPKNIDVNFKPEQMEIPLHSREENERKIL
mgnify:CR=1 FL=1